MKRRIFLKAMGAAGAAGIAAPAIAQIQPTIRWRFQSSFNKNLDVLWIEHENFTKRISEMTDGRFQIQIFAAGEIVGGLQVLDGVQNGTIEMGQSLATYYIGKDPTFAFGTTLPFGLNARQQNAWWYWGGGAELMNNFFKTYNVIGFPAGQSGAQMGGWFRKEIKSLDDLKGLKMRIAGMGGFVMRKLGVVPQQIAPGDIYPSLERGTIDAVEWVGPHDDEKLGFSKVAPFYYYPGWWEPTSMFHNFINLDAWNKLPRAYQAALESTTAHSSISNTANYDHKNPSALRRLVGGGTQLRAFPKDTIDAAYKAAFEVYDEIAAGNENFRKVYTPWKDFRTSIFLWHRIAENQLENATYALYQQSQGR